MTPVNIWALTAGGVVVAGGIAGALVWNMHKVEAPGASAKPPAVALESAPPPKQAKPDNAPQVADLGTASPKPQTKPEPPAGHGEPPHFDIVRVEPSGDAVLAGKGDPNAKVALLDSGKVVAETETDSNGNFVILPPTLKPGSYDLSLRQSEAGNSTTDSKQNVAVSVPAKQTGQVMVAVAEPGKPTKLLSAPPKAPESTGAPNASTEQALPDLAIRSAEIENGTGFYATGTATPGTRVEVYLNGSHVAQVVAGPDGQWSLKVKRGLQGGRYAVRADAIGSSGKVVARAEVPFDVPLDVADASKPGSSRTVAAPTAPPNPVQPPAVAIAPDTPPAQQAQVPAPEPAVAAAAKAAVGAAPAVAPPSMAVAAPTRPADRKVPPQQMAVAAVGPSGAKPALTETQPSTGPTAQSAATTAASAAPASSANAVIETVETALVVRGDNLWNISRLRLGDGSRYTRIYAANVSQIRNPSLIYPGQVFVVPSQ